MPAPTDEAPTDTLIHRGRDALKSSVAPNGQTTVGAYCVRFTGPEEKDGAGEYFTAKTNFGKSHGNGVPTLFHHGLPVKGLERMQDLDFPVAATRRDDYGIYAETTLDLGDPDQAWIAGMCAKGLLKWSTGSARHAVRKGADGEIKRWFMCELSFTPVPCDAGLPAILPLKSLPAVDDATADALVACPAVDSSEAVVPPPTFSLPTMTDAEIAAEKAATEKAQHEAVLSAVKARELAIDEIYEIGEQFHCAQDARKAVKEGATPDDFRKHVLGVLKARPLTLDESVTKSGDAMSRKDFDALSPVARTAHLKSGGKLTD